MFLQITTGTNKLYDPLNGLFAISTLIISETDFKHYPKRYGYPYYFQFQQLLMDIKRSKLTTW